MRKRRRLVTTVLAAVLCGAAAGCTGSGQPSTTGSTSPAIQTSSAAPANVTVCITPAVTCAGEMKVEPVSIILSGDSSTFVRHLTWTGWGSPSAEGTGILEQDDCNPNCAQGHLHAYQATISLSDLTSYGSGEQAYADMLVNAPPAANANNDYLHLVP